MLSFSVVVTAYKNDEYLPGCLGSVSAQTYPHWECVVVNDASPDNTRQISEAFAEKDARFKVVNLGANRGLHLARAAGVDACSGDYLLFLDADDELAPTALEELSVVLERRPVDMLHFGIEVVSAGVSEEGAASFGSYINGKVDYLPREDLCRAIFSADGGYLQDWRTTQRVYRTSLARRAFSLMTAGRLERAEDCYETLVLCDLSEGELTDNSIKALRYFYGRGVTGESVIDGGTFRRFVDQFWDCMSAMEEYASSASADPALPSCVDGAKRKLCDLLMNDWDVRVPGEEKLPAAEYAAKTVGALPVAEQLMRLVRDKAFSQWSGGESFTGAEEYLSWYRLGEELARRAGDEGADEYATLRLAARDHIADLERRSAWAGENAAPSIIKRSSYEKQPVRIFVTTHKDVDTFHSDILQPVQVGAKSPRRRLLWAFQDDEGENIAGLNAMYCELTTQYWAWKNVEAEYYGFCHYRRYFDFSDEWHEENPYGEVMDNEICWGTQALYRLDDASIAETVKGCDVITTGVNDFSKFPEAYENPLDLYRRSPYLHVEDLERAVEIMREMHPEYGEDADAYLHSSRSCFCNMFIMRRQMFRDYCSWLFPILERFVDEWDTAHLSHESLRTPGHLSERLLNIYLLHEKRMNPGLVWKQLQCVHFEHPEHHVVEKIEPAESHGLPVVPVVFASDDGYVPMVTTTILSMLKNASKRCFYDIVVLEKDISETHQREMRSFFSAHPNASVRFVNVWPLIRAYDLQTSNAHISVETYYRFLIQDVLSCYDKVLYLDSDLIIEGDVSELFAVDLGDNILAAAHDIDYAGNLDLNDGERVRYSKDVLGLRDPFSYFQAGVLLMSTQKMRRLHMVEEWLEMAAEPKYIYDDQDILNAECEGGVVFLDTAWNVMINCGDRFKRVFSFAPAAMYDDFMAAYLQPKVIHYAGYEKPWKPGSCDLAERFWWYARETPYYERLLLMAYSDSRQTTEEVERARREVIEELTRHERALAEDSPVRGVADAILPLGSRRREALKGVVRALRGRR